MDNKYEDARLKELNEAIYSVCGVPSEMFGNDKSPSAASAKIQLDMFQKKIEKKFQKWRKQNV